MKRLRKKITFYDYKLSYKWEGDTNYLISHDNIPLFYIDLDNFDYPDDLDEYNIIKYILKNNLTEEILAEFIESWQLV